MSRTPSRPSSRASLGSSRCPRALVRSRRLVVAVCAVALLAAACSDGGDGGSAQTPTSDGSTSSSATAPTTTVPKIQTVPGMPAVVDPNNLYSEAGAGKLSPAVAGHRSLVYVPNRTENTLSVIDPATMQVIDKYPVGINPQHVVPSWDLQTLYVTDNAEGRDDGTLTPIDPKTGKRAGDSFLIDDPYNMYFTPDGKSAMVVAEARLRLDFYDPHTWQLQTQLSVPECDGINHADFSIDGSYVIFTCEFNGSLAKIDWVNKKVIGYLPLSGGGMPQDIRSAPNGKTFYVAEMTRGGVYTVDPTAFTETGFIPTGMGAHGLYPSRDASVLYVANRGHSKLGNNLPDAPGGVSVIDFADNHVVTTWMIPGGGSPDMGDVSVDGKMLWLAGRYDDEVYAIDTATGAVTKIPVGKGPHGLAVWPQPGRYSVGHTGNMR